MTTALTKVAYTTAATAKGGRAGHVRSADGVLDLDLAQPGTSDSRRPTRRRCSRPATRPASRARWRNRAKTKDVDTSDSTVTAEVSFGPSEDGGFGLAVELKVRDPGRRAGAGTRADRAGPPVLPVLQGHPRQHRRHPHGVRRRQLGATADAVGRMMGTWPSACSTCSRSASARRRRTPSGRCARRDVRAGPGRRRHARRRRPRAGRAVRLARRDRARARQRPRGDPRAAGRAPGDRRHRDRRCPRRRGARDADGSSCSASTTAALGDDDLVLHRRQSLPFHPNGMRFFAFDADDALLRERTYYSVGGGFVVDEAAAGADRIKARRHRRCPTRSCPATQLLAQLRGDRAADQRRDARQRAGLAHRGRGPGRAARDLGGHAASACRTAGRTRARCRAG